MSKKFPRRFRKDIVKAATVKYPTRLNAPAVSAEGIENVLQNIGMGDRMPRSEIEGILSEVGARPMEDGGENGVLVISSEQLTALLSNN